MSARPAPRSAAWQRGPAGPAPPSAGAFPPSSSNSNHRPPPPSSYRPPPPQRFSRSSLPSSSLSTPPRPTPAISLPNSPASSRSSPASDHTAIHIRGRTRQRSSGSSSNGRPSSESPSKGRHASLCARPRFVAAVSCCLVAFSLLFFSSVYTHREELWGQVAAPSLGLHSFRLSGLVLASASPVPDQPDVPTVDDAVAPVVAEKEAEPAAPAAPASPVDVKPADVPTPPSPALQPPAPVQAEPPAPPAPTPTPDAAVPAPTPSTAVALNYRPNPVMKASIFPKTKEGYPLFSSPRTPQYSNFYCIGGRGRANTQGDRSCRWQNLCYRPSTEQWLFFQDPATNGSMPVLLDQGRVVTEFPADGFVNLRSMGNPQDAEYWAPVQVYEAIPPEALVKRRRADKADVYLLYRSHYPSNIGHVLGDDFFPLFNLQLSFNMLSNDNTLLMSKSCDRIFLPVGSPGKAAACRRFMDMLTPGMTDQPVLAVTDATFGPALGVEGDLVCLENVLTGNGPWGFQQSLGKAPAWWQYHAFYLANMGLSPNHTPRKHRITVSVKDGKRSIFNNAEMVEHLTKAFPAYEVEAIELYKLGGWKKELEYLLDTSVLITPCGGVSMSAMFLPHGAAMVIVDYWDVNKANTVGMEERLWSNLGYIRPFHYPFTEDEVVLAEEEMGKKLKRNVRQDMRDWGRVKVDLQRMETIVRAAIAHVDSFMVMGTN